MTPQERPPAPAESSGSAAAPRAPDRASAGTFHAVVAWTLAVALALTLGAAVAYALGTLLVRPLEIGEGEVLFEAQRLRSHLSLYVDPIVGAHDYGPVPSRYYVLYPPVWPLLLSQFPAQLAAPIARVISGVAWFGLLGIIALRLAPPERRRTALVAAACAGGTFMLARHCATATADTLAVVLACVALIRSVHLRRVDALSGALFALAAWTKPNVIGLAAGAFLHEIVVGRARALRAIIGAALVSSAFALWIHRASDGVWLTHLARSTMQPATFARGVEQVAPRLPFLGAPHLYAAYCGWRGREDGRVRLVLTALCTSLAWTMLSMAKVGSATTYWLEPSAAAVLLVAYAPIPRIAWIDRPIPRLGLALAALIGLGLNVVASLQALGSAVRRNEAIARVRSICGAQLGDLVLGEHPGLEMMLDGRLIETPYQMTHLVQQGRYPLMLWKSDVAQPQIRCLVMENDLLERPLSEVNLEDDRFGVEMRAALTERFRLVARDSGLWIYRARDARDADVSTRPN